MLKKYVGKEEFEKGQECGKKKNINVQDCPTCSEQKKLESPLPS